MKKLTQNEVDTFLEQYPNWTLRADGLAVTRHLKFTDFKQCWAFMNQIADQAEYLNHHPEWSNVYNRLDITLTTHAARGLTALDVEMVKKIETIN